MGEPALVDLVCGPASPLPETYQRYRLVARLGAGGQADVYRGVRLCGGVTSAPITVKVFRIDPRRPLADELRSWDKGDAALMDLNNRGVPGICRRADGFYGPPPHPTGATPSPRDAVPYQIYDYLHGVTLREYVVSRAGLSGPRLHAVTALTGLSETVRALHHPTEPGACPVLHMDIKPSNIMTLTNGDVRLIDFTGARYWRHEEITQIAYTPESGGPEALRGEVGPSYDVHGFGSVVFFILTGAPPRGATAPPMDRHPFFDGRPALRDHVLAALADRPSDRPSTMELRSWVDRLFALVRSSGVPDLGLDWSERPGAGPADVRRAVGRAKPVLAGTETDAFLRIELLERELVALRAAAPGAKQPDLELTPVRMPQIYPISAQPGQPVSAQPAPTSAPPAGGMAAGPTSGGPMVAPTSGGPPPPRPGGPGQRPISGQHPVPGQYPGGGQPVASGANAAAGAHPTSGGGAGVAMLVGRASVPPWSPPPPQAGYDERPASAARVRRSSRESMRVLKRGGSWSITGGVFALLCWIIWATANRSTGLYLAPVLFIVSLAVAAGLFIVLRLLGRLVLENWMHRVRRGATGSHLGVAAFLIALGVTYLQQTEWVVNAVHWLKLHT